MKTMDDIDQLAQDYDDSRVILASAMNAYGADLRKAQKEHLPRIRKAAAAAAKRRVDLEQAVEASPELFTKPKTQVLHGIKVGFKKGSGKIIFDDADTVVKLIKRHFPDRAEQLIKVTESPIRDALSRLSVAEAKKIGVTTKDATDAVTITIPNSNLDKLVEVLLNGDGS